MCTAFSWGEGRYFGRNLDLEYHYDEAVVTLGRDFPLVFKHLPTDCSHYAMIGIATVREGYPLFYDAMNEHGLSMAGLNFVGNAFYHKEGGASRLAPYELIPYLLSRAKTVKEAKKLLDEITLVATPFSDDLPLAELHFLLSDSKESLVIEPRRSGLKCYPSKAELLTNNPPYAFHVFHAEQYRHLSAEEQTGAFSRGLAAYGLPGDLSSASRFVRALFVKKHAILSENEDASLRQCFHILSSVKMVEGCIRLPSGMPKTVYSACLDRKKLCYHVLTYDRYMPISMSLSPSVTFLAHKIFS